jgi:hypothetical protein
MRVNAYHRRNMKRRRRSGAAARSISRSTVIGWWTVATTGTPRRRTQPEQPVAEALVVMDDVEVAGRRAARTRSVNVSGSGNAPVHMVSHSSQSTASRNSCSRGVRNGSGSR